MSLDFTYLTKEANGRLTLAGREINSGDRIEFAQAGLWLPARMEFDEERCVYVAVLEGGRTIRELEGLRARFLRP